MLVRRQRQPVATYCLCTGFIILVKLDDSGHPTVFFSHQLFHSSFGGSVRRMFTVKRPAILFYHFILTLDS